MKIGLNTVSALRFGAEAVQKLFLGTQEIWSFGFDPASLFASNEPGVWYDPSDTSTLFQDAAGTTPVTAVEQPVGLMLDKSRGLVLGPELVTNGTFDTDTSGWSEGAGSGAAIAWQSGTALLTTGSAGGRLIQSFSTVVGRTYQVSISRVGGTAATAGYRITTDALGGATGQIISNTTLAGNFNVTFVFTATSTTTVVAGVCAITTSVVSVQFDNISVRELPGNHAFQSVATTSRPVLSSRYNLLTKTEQFDDAAWGKLNATVTANAVVAPNGTLTADKLVESTASNAIHLTVFQVAFPASVASTVRVYAKSAGRSRVVLANQETTTGVNGAYAVFNLGTGAIDVSATTYGSGFSNASSSIVSVGDGWYLCSVTATSTASTRTISVNIDRGTSGALNQQYTGDGTSGIYIWGASLVPANQASLPYQRVNTSTDYDADPTKFPVFLRFDGSDDWLQTNTITPGTDKVQVFAGVRKLSDAGSGALVELSANAGVNSGTTYIFAPRTSGNPEYAFYSHGSAGFTGAEIAIATPYAAPITNTLTGLGDISGDSSILRVNGVQAAISTADQGTGNFLAYPLYIGRRGGTSFPFNGNLTQLIVRFGPNLPTATIEAAETYVNSKTKAY
jgi:hypothetical protein